MTISLELPIEAIRADAERYNAQQPFQAPVRDVNLVRNTVQLQVGGSAGYQWYRCFADIPLSDTLVGEMACVVFFDGEPVVSGFLWKGTGTFIHDHSSDDEGGQLDWDDIWADAVHDHSNAAEGGQLDWDDIWADAVHDHSNDAEGGLLGVGDHDHSAPGQGGQLDWDDIWSDAVHDHSAAGEGGEIPLASLGSYAQGSVIYGGGADWQALAHPGATAYHFQTTGAATLGWAQNITMADGTRIGCDATSPKVQFDDTNDELELTVTSGGIVLEGDAASPNVRGGYSGNSITVGVKGATISGGGVAASVNIVTDDYGTVGGGRDNQAGDNAGSTTDKAYATVAGGYGNEASDYGSFVGGGANNIASGQYATVTGGYTNIASGAWYSTISGGGYNTASAERSVIVGGVRGLADKYGQVVMSAGQFAATGDAQGTIQFTLRGITDDANWVEIFLNGANAQMTIATDTVWTFHALIAVTKLGCAESAGYEIVGVVENDGGTTTLLASTVTTLYEDDAAWDVRAAADDANDALIIEVRGDAAAIARWVATVKTAEVTYPT